jgi:hypothetical protein
LGTRCPPPRPTNTTAPAKHLASDAEEYQISAGLVGGVGWLPVWGVAVIGVGVGGGFIDNKFEKLEAKIEAKFDTQSKNADAFRKDVDDKFERMFDRLPQKNFTKPSIDAQDAQLIFIRRISASKNLFPSFIGVELFNRHIIAS